MAVIQISKMQVRRGQTAQTGFPQLSSGEFGWSIDTQQLFIGNGAVSEGAPAVGNTEIITEHNINNIFLGLSNGYVYTYNGESVNGVQARSIQSKLDDFVSLHDFIPAEGTLTEFTQVFKNAINHASSKGKPLYIPEGDWAVTATLYIRAGTEIRGAGPQKTIIRNTANTCTFQTESLIGTRFINNQSSIPGDGNAPKNINIAGLTFINSATVNATPILQLDCISDSVIEKCEFIGNPFVTTATTSLAKAIDFRDTASFPANATDNVTIKNCKFYYLSSAINSDYDCANITIVENRFTKLDEGIMLGKNLTGITTQRFGPQHIIISNNRFDEINKQAILAGSTSTSVSQDVNSSDNYFYNVGNNGRGDSTSTQVTEIIRFNSYGNYSNGDTFDRIQKINSGTTFLLGTSQSVSLVRGPVTLINKTPAIFNLNFTGTGFPMFGFPRNLYQFGTTLPNQVITIDYTINKPEIALIRQGTLEIMVSGANAIIKDDYTASEPVEGNRITFDAEVDIAKNLVIIFVANQSGFLGNISYTYTVRQ